MSIWRRDLSNDNLVEEKYAQKYNLVGKRYLQGGENIRTLKSNRDTREYCLTGGRLL